MPGGIALVGGDEFRQGCEDMDREIMRASGQAPAQVLVIPTAAVDGPSKAAGNGVRHFSSLGGSASQLMVLDRSQAEDAELVQAVDGAGVIYFTGGNPDYLLNTLRGSRLLEAHTGRSGEGSGTGWFERRGYGAGVYDAATPRWPVGGSPGCGPQGRRTAPSRKRKPGGGIPPAKEPSPNGPDRSWYRRPNWVPGTAGGLAGIRLRQRHRLPGR